MNFMIRYYISYETLRTMEFLNGLIVLLLCLFVLPSHSLFKLLKKSGCGPQDLLNCKRHYTDSPYVSDHLSISIFTFRLQEKEVLHRMIKFILKTHRLCKYTEFYVFSFDSRVLVRRNRRIGSKLVKGHVYVMIRKIKD